MIRMIPDYDSSLSGTFKERRMDGKRRHVVYRREEISLLLLIDSSRTVSSPSKVRHAACPSKYVESEPVPGSTHIS